MTQAAITSHDHPSHLDCTECGTSLDFDHYTVVAASGALCQGCANDAVPGLGDIAHGLSLIKWALIYELEHDQRSAVVYRVAEVGKLATDLASGALLLHYDAPGGSLIPLRPGGPDPHDTIRRHVIRAVPDGGAA